MDIKLYERIKDLRKKHGFKSKRAFAEALKTNENNVKGWENAKRPVFPSLDKLVAMCELFNCDLDYLVGRREERTYDIKVIHDLTGLSAEAIEKICGEKATINGEPVPSPTAVSLSHLIEAEGFQDFIAAYQKFEVAVIRLKEAVIPKAKTYPVDKDGNMILDGSAQSEEGAFSIIGRNKVTLRMDDATLFYMQGVADAVKNLCKPAYNESKEICMKNSERNDGGHE